MASIPSFLSPNSKSKVSWPIDSHLCTLNLLTLCLCEHRVWHRTLRRLSPNTFTAFHGQARLKIVTEDAHAQGTKGSSRSPRRQITRQQQAGHYLVHCPAPRCVPLLLQRKSRNETEKRETNSDTSTKRENPSENSSKHHSGVLTWIVVGFTGLATKLLTSV